MKRDDDRDHASNLGIGGAARDGLDLRPDQGICRDQRRLSLVKLVLVVAVALVDADGRVLIAQRPKGKPLEGLWEFPGGKMERRRAARGGADPRTRRGTRHRGQGRLPRAAHFREPYLRRLPPADAALRLPQMGGLRSAARRAGAEMGAAEGSARLSDAAGGRAADPASRGFAGVRPARCAAQGGAVQVL